MEKSHIFKTIDLLCDNCNIYYCDDGFWIINPKTKEWVIHVGSSRLDYLWFNYDIFHNTFNNYLSFNIIKNSSRIKEWAIDRMRWNIGENFHPNKLPGEYDWSDDFKPEKVMDKGVVISDMNYLLSCSHQTTYG